jgi:TolA-binding protein
MAARDRFPRSREGHEAAFFLGGISEDQPAADSSKTALEWYGRYLAESPQGPYAAHALGRTMVLMHKLQGAAAARPIATQYLERFPAGPYAAAAKKLVE